MNSEEINQMYMSRCIELAANGLGLTYPNPMVGCVVVHNGQIIGEGYHVQAGRPHAEVNAISSVGDKSKLSDSTLYVSLEPCAHYGRTPPCAKLIIDSKIPRVVVGCVDSFSKVSGKGIEMLRQAGIEVTVGVTEKECRALNRRFFTFHEKKRPYIILKWAESADGYIDAPRDAANRPTWLTNEHCRRMVHKQRAEEQAILIGANTAVLDNPQLTARLWCGNQPKRIIIDPRLRVPTDSKIFSAEAETIVINTVKDGTAGNVRYVRADLIGTGSAKAIAEKLHELEIQSVIVEGGTRTLTSFIDSDLWDEAFVYRGAITLGGGVAAPKFNHRANDFKTIDETTLFHYINQRV